MGNLVGVVPDLLTYTYNRRRCYFDEMAQELKTKQPGPDIAYVAEVTIDPNGVMLPGGETDPWLRRLTISVKNTTLTSFDFDHAELSNDRHYSAVVTRTGK